MSIRQQQNDSDFTFNGRTYVKRTNNGSPVFDISMPVVATGGASVGTGSTPPTDAADGDLWYDTSTAQLHVYTSTLPGWIQANGGGGGGGASVTTAETAPTDAADGDLWFDESNGQLFVYTDAVNGWVQTNGGGGGGSGGALGSFSQYVDSAGYIYLTGTSDQNWATVHTIPGFDSSSLYAYTLINSAFSMYVNARHSHGRFMNGTIAEVQGLRYGVDMPAGGSYGWPVALVSDGEYADGSSSDRTLMSFYYPQQGYVGTPMDSGSIVDGTSKGTSISGLGGSMYLRNSSSIGPGLYARIDPSNGNIQIRSSGSQGNGVLGGLVWFKLNTTTVPCYLFDSTGQKFVPELYTHT